MLCAGSGAATRRHRLSPWAALVAVGAAILAIAACAQLHRVNTTVSAETAALADLAERSGGRCFLGEDILRVVPSDIDAKVRDVGATGWIRNASIWAGDDLSGAADDLGGTLFDGGRGGGLDQRDRRRAPDGPAFRSTDDTRGCHHLDGGRARHRDGLPGRRGLSQGAAASRAPVEAPARLRVAAPARTRAARLANGRPIDLDQGVGPLGAIRRLTRPPARP